MQLLLFLFLLIRSQAYFFDPLTQNDTYVPERHLQQWHQPAEKVPVKPMISNKVFLLIVACLFLVVVATLLTVYFTKDQMRDFVNRIHRRQRGPVIHQFNPQGIVSEQSKQPSVSNEQSHETTLGGTKTKLGHENQKRERTSVHAFINPSSKHQRESLFDNRHSQSAADLFLYR